MSFDLRLYYPLLHAFDETGRRMFADAWTGSEAWAKDYGDPAATRLQRKAIVDQLNALNDQEDRLKRTVVDESDPEASEAHASRWRELYDERKRLKRSLHDLPEVTHSWIQDAEMFQRRCAVERELRDAFRSDDLMLIHDWGTVVEWDRWANSTDFRVYFSLSMIQSPRSEMGRRHGAAFVKQDEFDAWAKRFGVHGIDPESQCRNWLRAEVQRGVKRMTRDEYEAHLLDEMDGLKPSHFKRAWRAEAQGPFSRSGPFR